MRNAEEWKITDDFMKEGMQGICGQIKAPEHLKRQIDSRIAAETNKEINMKRFSVKKTVIAVAVACLTIGTVCVAATGMKYSVTGNHLSPKYTAFKELDKAEAKAGFSIDAVESFSNGFAFSDMSVKEIRYMNGDGEQEGSRNEIWINYTKQDGSLIYFTSLKKYEEEQAGREPNQILKCGDVTAKFYKTAYKFVPPDYELTEEDRENEQRDDYEISYGSQEIEYSENYSVSWEKDGTFYNMGGMNLSISPDEMLNMAKRIIESGK